MNKLTYLQSYQDAGLYREWILENFYRLYSKGIKLQKHLKALSKLTNINIDDLEKEIITEYKNS